jgi:hypothetical protein
MKKWIASTSASVLTISLMFIASAAARAECIQGSDGRTYSCGGSPRWNFETGKWTCTNSANGETVSGDKADCGGGRDAGIDDDLLEPLVDDRKPRKGPIKPGDPRKRREIPK